MNTIARGGRWLWRFLCSRRLAVLLLAALLLASLVASLVPQMPAGPAARDRWLEAAALRYGPATPLLRALGLFDAYHAPWYAALLAAVALNTLACTLRRLPPLWRALLPPTTIRRPAAFYARAAHTARWPTGSAGDAVAAIEAHLARRRTRVRVDWEAPGACAHLYAERGRWAQAVTLVGHLAALLLVLALAARPALSWQEAGVTLLPGEPHPIGHGVDASVRAGPLAVDLHPNGQPRDYRVPLAVLPGGAPEDAGDAEVVTRTVRINHPLTVSGIAFHLQSYGPAVRVTAPEGALSLALTGDAAGDLALPEAGLLLRVAPQPGEEMLFVEARGEDGALLGSGLVADGSRVEVGGTPLTFDLTRYTTWQVSRDPTLWPAVAAAGLLAAAAAISLWLPHRRLWVRVDGPWVHLAGDRAAVEALARDLGAPTSASDALEARDG